MTAVYVVTSESPCACLFGEMTGNCGDPVHQSKSGLLTAANIYRITHIGYTRTHQPSLTTIPSIKHFSTSLFTMFNSADEKPPHPHHTYDGQDEDSVPVFPVPERNLGKNGLPTPFISGDLDTYREVWKKTVGDDSDEWWRKVSSRSGDHSNPNPANRLTLLLPCNAYVLISPESVCL